MLQQILGAIMNHSQDQQHTGFDPSALIGQIAGAAESGNLNPQMVQNAIQNHAQDQQHTGFDPTALLGQVGNIFGQHQSQGGGQFGNVLSSDQDRYGDPGAQQTNFGNVKSSDEDPYGDPGAQ